MSARIKVLIASVVAIVFLIGIYVISIWASDSFSIRIGNNEKIGIRFAILDENKDSSVESIAQLILFPEQKRMLAYFVNTDASLPDDSPFIESSPASIDFFPDITDIDNTYYIHITKANFIRLINLMGGVTLFFEEPRVFDEGLYNHLQGTRFYSGEQYLEYMLARKTTQPNRAWLNGIERLQRIESMIMNLLWRRKQLIKTLDSKPLIGFSRNLVKTNLSLEEMDSFLAFISDEDVHFSMMEIPLEIDQKKVKKRLIIKEKSARNQFIKFKEDIKSDKLNEDDFPVEVLNGTDTGGLARRIKQFLQDRGLQVLDADNYGYKPVANSIVVERSADTFKASHLMELTGIKQERVIFNKSYVDVDASFIIGNDFKIKQLKLK